ncbi:hypothetical protein DL96DRAFT_1687349 [Flagelloscypha sp. PMI_526]|nr:hypothetical protein DL96DRAFT_1687349 [Flagelloscypha sp. PMI_526]
MLRLLTPSSTRARLALLETCMCITRGVGHRPFAVNPYSRKFCTKIASPITFTRSRTLGRSAPFGSIVSLEPSYGELVSHPLSNIGMNPTDPFILNAISQEVQNLPLMLKEDVESYAKRCFSESKELCKRGEHCESTTPWLKGCLSEVVYLGKIGKIDEYAICDCSFSIVHFEYYPLKTLLSKLQDQDKDREIGFNMNILREFLVYSGYRANGINYSQMRVRHEDWFKDLQSEGAVFDKSDITAVNFLYSQYKELAFPRDATNLIMYLALGELRKGSILLLAAPKDHRMAARHFVLAHRIIASTDNTNQNDLLHVYQKQLPAPVFENVLRLMAATI